MTMFNRNAVRMIISVTLMMVYSFVRQYVQAFRKDLDDVYSFVRQYVQALRKDLDDVSMQKKDTLNMSHS